MSEVPLYIASDLSVDPPPEGLGPLPYFEPLPHDVVFLARGSSPTTPECRGTKRPCLRCRAKLEQISQSRPDSGLGFGNFGVTDIICSSLLVQQRHIQSPTQTFALNGYSVSVRISGRRHGNRSHSWQPVILLKTRHSG